MANRKRDKFNREITKQLLQRAVVRHLGSTEHLSPTTLRVTVMDGPQPRYFRVTVTEEQPNIVDRERAALANVSRQTEARDAVR